jgi:predicted negative regulator of RcsB-dependent stress response
MVYTATDKEQIEDIKRWWKDYGQTIATAVVIGLAVGAGWKLWGRYTTGQENAASQVYQAMQQAVHQKQFGVAQQYAKQLQTQYKRTTYAKLGSLVAARAAVEQEKYQQAVTALQWVVDNSKSTDIKTIAQLRLARVQLQMGQAQQALDTVNQAKGATFTGLIAQTKGQVYKALGKNKQAQAAFTQAHTAFATQGQQSFIVELNRG